MKLCLEFKGAQTFRDALDTQQVLDAILESAKMQKWINVAKG